MSTTKKHRVTCSRRYPTNELFKKWLEELRDGAVSNGLKTQYVFGKALRSVQACPLELRSAEDAKVLDNIGDGIVRVLAGKLRQFVDANGPPTFGNLHLAGVDVGDDSADADAAESSKKRAKRKSNPRRYIPGYRTGGYAVLRSLFDVYKDQYGSDDDDDGENDMPFVGKRELQAAAQRYCDESLTTATRDNPYTAWSSVNTLIKHDLVRMNRAGGSAMQYALTKEGLAMAKRLAEAARPSPGESSTLPPFGALATASPAKGRTKKSKAVSNEKQLPVSPGSPRKSTPQESASAVCRHGSVAKPVAEEDTPADWMVYDPMDDELYHDIPVVDTKEDLDIPPPLFRRISDGILRQRAVRLGYIYVDSNGFETRLQDNAYVFIDETIGALLYLVKTTNQYVQKTGPAQWHDCDELPSFVKNVGTSDCIFMYMKGEFADDFAPDILETTEEYELKEPAHQEPALTQPEFGQSSGLDRPASLTQPLSRHDRFRLDKELGMDLDRPASTTQPSSGGTRFIPDVGSGASSSQGSGTSGLGARLFSSILPPMPNPVPRTNSNKDLPRVFCLEPDTFDIVLMVDYGETVGGIPMFGEVNNRKKFLVDGLSDLKINYVQRRLPVGDYLFVAIERHSGIVPSSATVSKISEDRVLVLGPVIERKRMDDLAASIRDGRFHEQKIRLHNCGVHRVIYLVEDYGKSMDTFSIKASSLRSAIMGTQVCDGFDVVRTKNPDESTTYLANVLADLRTRFSHKRLISRQEDSLSMEELIELDADEIPLITFREFSELSTKTRALTVGTAFARCLSQFAGMSLERAEAIRKVYPTLSHLLNAYKACNGDESEEDRLLETIPCGQLGRNLGSKLSKDIARFFCNTQPFDK